MFVATMIAAKGVVFAEPILIVGAMVVGPDFGPLAALSVGLVRWLARMIGQPASRSSSGSPSPSWSRSCSPRSTAIHLMSPGDLLHSRRLTVAGDPREAASRPPRSRPQRRRVAILRGPFPDRVERLSGDPALGAERLDRRALLQLPNVALQRLGTRA
ncbi:hypothetical protein [Leifsonia sp. AG29]|uniref:hypothetical protein n=1 Tax=Leifsonia sp. AG29 TaxID=2598860 RepID=UPI00131CBEBF|nr:hypothetical protein [Leifsonia sp. AG29]